MIQKPSGSRENKQKLETSRNSLECGGKFEPVAGLPVDLNISVRGTLAFFGKSLDRGGTSGNPTHTSSACLGAEPRPPAGDGPFVAEI